MVTQKVASVLALMMSLVGFCISPMGAKAQKSQAPQALTGCLVKGEPVSLYKLVMSDGTEWNLASNKIKLDRYFDHLVTVKGNVVEAADTKSGHPTKAESAGNIFQVSAITVQHPTCPK